MLKIIDKCPTCDSPLERVNSQLFCRNKLCSAQTSKKLEYFAKTMGIKGLGEKTIEKLELTEISDIYHLEDTTLVSILGEKIGEKLNNEIINSLNADLATIIASFSIPLVGNTTAQKLCTVVESIWDINEETCKKAGLGEKATINILSFLHEEKGLLESLPFTYKNIVRITPPPTGKTVVITGKLNDFKSRDEAKVMLESWGFKVGDTVSKNTTYLIDDEGVESTKRKKAENLNIQILTFTELLNKENIKHVN